MSTSQRRKDRARHKTLPLKGRSRQTCQRSKARARQTRYTGKAADQTLARRVPNFAKNPSSHASRLTHSCN
eukprot:5932577-Pyramimonas_sp.AAC.1